MKKSISFADSKTRFDVEEFKPAEVGSVMTEIKKLGAEVISADANLIRGEKGESPDKFLEFLKNNTEWTLKATKKVE
jgi:hypothetical protein